MRATDEEEKTDVDDRKGEHGPPAIVVCGCSGARPWSGSAPAPQRSGHHSRPRRPRPRSGESAHASSSERAPSQLAPTLPSTPAFPQRAARDKSSACGTLPEPADTTRQWRRDGLRDAITILAGARDTGSVRRNHWALDSGVTSHMLARLESRSAGRLAARGKELGSTPPCSMSRPARPSRTAEDSSSPSAPRRRPT